MENGLVAYYGLETRRQIPPSAGVGDLEEEAWVREFLGLQGVSHLLLAVPEPFVQLPLCEAGGPHELAEVALVPFAVVLLESFDKDFELFLVFAALGFANQTLFLADELFLSLLDLLGLVVDLTCGDETALLLERGSAVRVASLGAVALLLSASPGAALPEAWLAGHGQALGLSGLGQLQVVLTIGGALFLEVGIDGFYLYDGLW